MGNSSEAEIQKRGQGLKVKDLYDSSPHVLGRLLLAAMTSA